MKTTLTKKLLKIFLPLLIIPIVLMLAFYYAYMAHIVKRDIVELSETLFIKQNSMIERELNSQTELHTDENDLLPCFTIIDKNLNVIVSSKKENTDKIYDSKYNDVIARYIEKVFTNRDVNLTQFEKNDFMIKPLVNSENEIVAFSLCDYKNLLEKKEAVMRQTFFYIIFIIIFISFINIILTIIFAFNIVNPIRNLIEGTKIISDGDLSHKIDVTSDDEIGVLIKDFNIMIEKLKVADIKSKAASDAKSSFLANMSHEIRTPMNAIIGFIDILIKKENDAEKLKYLNIVEHSGKTLLEIINDILDISKIESGKLSIEKILFQTKEPFTFITELFSEKAKEKKIKLNLILDEKLPQYAYGDLIRIKQIYANLLSNAIKFSHDDSSIDVDVLYANKKLICSVKDNGIGIKPENIKNIFNAFEQEDASTTRRFGGTGLGLSISKTFTELMGGDLEVKSEFNHGSTFTFSLDIFSNVPEVEHTEELEAEPNKKDIGSEALSSISEVEHKEESETEPDKKDIGRKVLIVEDNTTNQLLLQMLLEDFGLDVVIANDGLEAVEAYKNMRFALIFMDENMPNMNGIEATKQIRELEAINGFRTPIVAVTANAMVEDRTRFLDADMDDYIPKPIDFSELQRVIAKFLQKKI